VRCVAGFLGPCLAVGGRARAREGDAMKNGSAVVLLSGGFDSVAALCWAACRYPQIMAVSFLYGQPSAHQELSSARQAADALNIRCDTLALADAVSGVQALGGYRSVVVPVRNLVFLAAAASYASKLWPDLGIDLIVGCNLDDDCEFFDCRRSFLAAVGRALCLGSDVSFRVVAPWIDSTKAEILEASKANSNPVAWGLVARSWSCYYNEGPCGACGACVKRAAAFALEGERDLCVERAPVGGDRARQR